MTKEATLIFYIGNGGVSAGIALHQQKQLPLVISTRTKDFGSREFKDRSELEQNIYVELKKLVQEVRTIDMLKDNCKGIHISQTLVVLACPWHICQTSLINIREDRPFTITSDLIQQAIDMQAKKHTADQVGGGEVSILEQKVIKVSLNGYPTQLPIGKKASSLELSVFFSFSEKAFRDSIYEIIFSQFHNEKIVFHSQSLAAFSAIRDIWKDKSDYILADVTREMSELIVIRDGQVTEVSSFPAGSQFLRRKLGTVLHVKDDVAESLLRMYGQDSIDQQLKEKITTALADIKKDWLEHLTTALSSISTDAALPNTFFLFAELDAINVFEDYILSEQYQQFSFSEGKFEVTKIAASDLSILCSYDKDIKPDLTISIGAAFNSKII